MKKYLFLTSALVVLSGTAEAACIQTPSCSSLGYESTSSCTGGVKCPFGNAWNCTAIDLSSQITELTNKITEQTNTITNLETQITEIRKEVTTSNCLVGDILYSDKTCNSSIIVSKTPIGIVFDGKKQLAIALEQQRLTLGGASQLLDTGVSSITDAKNDWNGKNNTQKILNMTVDGKPVYYSLPAVMYVNQYKTTGTSAGDWYLPAAGELNAIYENHTVISTAMENLGKGQLSYTCIWSSTLAERSINEARKAWSLEISVGLEPKYADMECNVYPAIAF